MSSCSGWIQPLDFNCLFINSLAGTTLIFGLLSLLVLFILAGKLRMPNIAIGSIIVLYSIMFFDKVAWLTYLSVFGLLLIVGIAVATVLKRN